MQPMQDSPIYTKDTIGLRTLDRAGRLNRLVLPNISHEGFVHDMRSLTLLEPYLR